MRSFGQEWELQEEEKMMRGKFSTKRKNEKLKEIFDEAIEN